MSDESIERIGGETVWEGKMVKVAVDRFRHPDGSEVERELVRHPGSVGIVVHDSERLWLVRQPREVVEDPGLLEIVAGKLDAEDESPLETAKRELAEEIGKTATTWEHLTTFWASPGFTDERIHLYVATDLADADAEPDEGERIEIVTWPLVRIDELIDGCEDSKSLIGLMWLRRRMATAPA